MQCKAKTKKGIRCQNFVSKGKEYCAVHKDHVSGTTLIAGAIGAIAGYAILPGIGGALGGVAIGLLTKDVFQGNKTMKKKVFVSFDFDNDKILKDFLIGQSKLPDSPFEIIDWSMKEAAPERSWEDKAEARIKQSDLVIVMVGRYTYRAPGVLKEVKMARDNRKPIVQIIGYKDGSYTPVPEAGRLYAWNWDNLKNLVGN
jgi:hypothetical protein